MTIQDLGAIGELVGAIAVIATLVYLSVQTRLSRKALEDTANFASLEAMRDVPTMYSRYRAMVSRPELAEVMVKARTDEALSEKEQILFVAVFEELIYLAATSFLSSQTGASPHDKTGDVAYVVLVLRENPRAIEIWQQQHEIVAAISREFVESVSEGLVAD